MSIEIYDKQLKNRYWVSDSDCPKRKCYAPGVYYSRGATASGSRNTGRSFKTCLTNAYRGCPKYKNDPDNFKKSVNEGGKK